MLEAMHLLVISILFAGCSGFAIPQNSKFNSPAVERAPYQVLISYGDAEPVCGGALVTDSVILTSTSCIYRSFQSIENFMENGELFGGGDVLVYLLGNITKVVIHPEFNQKDSANDIALIKVWQPLPKRRIAPVPLANNWSLEKGACTISTWWNSETNRWGNLSPREIRLEKCFDHKENDLLCASNLEGLHTINKKDIGSPIVCDGMLTGIVTERDNIVNLTFYYSWIKEVIRQLGPLNNTSEILEPTTVDVLDRLQSQKIITLLKELLNQTKNKTYPSNELQSYWNPRVVVPLNYVIFATIIFLFAIMLYHTLVNVALVYFSRK